MYDRVLVITINSFYSKVPSTDTKYRYRGTYLVPYHYRGTFKKYHAHHCLFLLSVFTWYQPSLLPNIYLRHTSYACFIESSFKLFYFFSTHFFYIFAINYKNVLTFCFTFSLPVLYKLLSPFCIVYFTVK